MLSRTLILKTSAWGPVERLVRRSPLFRGLVKRFIAGDNLDEALKVCQDLVDRGFHTTLDLLGENVTSLEAAMAGKNAYLDILTNIAKSRCAPKTNVSIKLTMCGFDQGDEVTERNLREILTHAQELGNFVRVDMEGSPYTERTVRLIERVWQDFKNTGTVLQTYLYRTPDDVQLMNRLGARVRLVKGAYLEPEAIAYPQKAKVDEAYVECAKELMLHGNYPALATHDEQIIAQIKAFAQDQGIDKSRFEFQMLFGIRRDLQEGLLKEGFNVRVYVPFGHQWYPYFTRRLAERPANVMFIVKSLLRG